jgi:peptidoglycan L-alanyl-D-glutamate endopeptidase CwlK
MRIEQSGNGFSFGRRSKENLLGVRWGVHVHGHLVAIATLAIQISPVDFGVYCGVRTLEEQQKELDKGTTWTLASRHRTGHAIDCVPWVDGRYSWAWPEVNAMCDAIATAARFLGIPIEQGRHWKPSRRDGAHQELPRRNYPARGALTA